MAPRQRISDVRGQSTAHAEGASRDELGSWGHTGDTLAVVRGRGDGPGNVGAVPGRGHVLPRAAAAADTALHPIALVAGVGIAAVAVACHVPLRDEVVAADLVGPEVWVIDNAGVDDGDCYSIAPRLIPCFFGVDTSSVVRQAPLFAILRIVGCGCGIHAHIRFDVLHLREACDILHEAVGFLDAQGLIELNACRAVGICLGCDDFGACL